MNKTLDSNDLVVNISAIISNMESRNRNKVFEESILDMTESLFNFLNIEIEHPELDFNKLNSTHIEDIDLEKSSNTKLIKLLKKYIIEYIEKVIQGYNRRTALIPVINNYILNLKCLLG